MKTKSKRGPKPLVLCVDDEPGILEGVELHLRRRFRVRTALGGDAGLQVLDEEPQCCVVMSDMRMPKMNGAEFLTKARTVAPNATRMLLTGQTDIDSAIAAVNEGQIFRFLTKPCPPDRLLATFEAAMEQHRLVTAEKELLEKTVHGSVKALTGVLGLTHPLSFGRSVRLQQYVGEMCEELSVEPRWPVEIAAMVLQLGSVTLSESLAEKVYYGRELSKPEQELVDQGPSSVRTLLGNIPRLEPVMEILEAIEARPRDVAPRLKRSVNMLRIALDFDVLTARGLATDDAVATLRNRGKTYPRKLLDALALHRASEESRDVREVPIAAVREGMVFAEDVHTAGGVLLVARGFEITAGFVTKARGFRPGYVAEPVRVLAPECAEAVAS